ncbi:hypothetical protein [Eubacterium oxidoreducens]|uniref:Winged helix DNA-binding domain-containing protein n=1 Tax=Eubacterium oxidoreducens TaxID=1732 RepID=A0A1G6BX66_EUBOX|nr:hypothetical protein [Eubacterium oxidoreducens]SDB25201.1 hypothetical protein SAMN02910417_01871 [Eubacterium oxidoreducens]
MEERTSRNGMPPMPPKPEHQGGNYGAGGYGAGGYGAGNNHGAGGYGRGPQGEKKPGGPQGGPAIPPMPPMQMMYMPVMMPVCMPMGQPMPPMPPMPPQGGPQGGPPKMGVELNPELDRRRTLELLSLVDEVAKPKAGKLLGIPRPMFEHTCEVLEKEGLITIAVDKDGERPKATLSITEEGKKKIER